MTIQNFTMNLLLYLATKLAKWFVLLEFMICRV